MVKNGSCTECGLKRHDEGTDYRSRNMGKFDVGKDIVDGVSRGRHPFAGR